MISKSNPASVNNCERLGEAEASSNGNNVLANFF